MKISKIPPSPLPPSFSPPLDFGKFQFPLDFIELKNPVPPFTRGGGGATMGQSTLKTDIKPSAMSMLICLMIHKNGDGVLEYIFFV